MLAETVQLSLLLDPKAAGDRLANVHSNALPDERPKHDIVGDEGEVKILGMLRTTQVRNKFTPENHPEKGEWYWADVEAMATYAGGEQAGVHPVFIEEVFGESVHFM